MDPASRAASPAVENDQSTVSPNGVGADMLCGDCPEEHVALELSVGRGGVQVGERRPCREEDGATSESDEAAQAHGVALPDGGTLESDDPEASTCAGPSQPPHSSSGAATTASITKAEQQEAASDRVQAGGPRRALPDDQVAQLPGCVPSTPRSSIAAEHLESQTGDRRQCDSTSTTESTAVPTLEAPSWMNDPHVWWRHPVARITMALLILALDMALFFEDPVNDSQVEAVLPGLGHLYGFFFLWPSSAGAVLLRVVLCLVALVVGCTFGRQVIHHRLLRNRMRLDMFQDCKGTFAVMSCCCIVTLLVACLLYDLILGTSELDGSMRMTTSSFCKLSQCCSVSLDIIAIVMIVDSVLQDTKHYSHWLPGVKRFWVGAWGGWFRIVATWAVTIAALALNMNSILSWDIGEDYNQNTFGGISEVGRACLLSCIICCDLCTVAQDWDFPSFSKPLQVDGSRVLIAGTFVPELRFEALPMVLRRLPKMPAALRRWAPPPGFFTFHVTGSWLTYGPLLLVILVDLFCAKNQLLYDPKNYGQYVLGSGEGNEAWRIWAIQDTAYLSEAYSKGVVVRPELIAYEARWNETTGEFLGRDEVADFRTLSMHTDNNLRYLCAAPGLLMIPVFFALVLFANRRKAHLRASSECSDQVLSAKRSVVPVSAGSEPSQSTVAASDTEEHLRGVGAIPPTSWEALGERSPDGLANSGDEADGKDGVARARDQLTLGRSNSDRSQGA